MTRTASNNRRVSAANSGRGKRRTRGNSKRKPKSNKQMLPETVPTERVQTANPARIVLEGEVIPASERKKQPHLRHPADWLKEMARIYRKTRRGQLPIGIGKRLVEMAKSGAEVAKQVTDTEELTAIRTKLETIGVLPSDQPLAALPVLPPEDGTP